jgi:hypothetical protein
MRVLSLFPTVLFFVVNSSMAVATASGVHRPDPCSLGTRQLSPTAVYIGMSVKGV